MQKQEKWRNIRNSQRLLPYSIDGAPSVRRRAFAMMELSTPYPQSQWLNEFTTRWVRHSNFIPIWVSRRAIQLSKFSDYQKFIELMQS